MGEHFALIIDMECSICLEEISGSDSVALVCGHRFHAVCYAKHMESSQQDPWCPICRSETFGASARFLR